jgi:ABC-type multidrug transport system fused ATPase/permease subunit
VWRLLRPHRPALLLAVVIAFLGAAAALAQPLLARRVITAIEADRPVLGLAGVLAVALLVAAALSGVQRYVLQRTGEALVLATRTALVRRLLRLPVAELDRRRTGDLISRVGADTTLLRTVVTSGLVDLVSGVVVAGGALAAMAFVDRVLLGVTVLAVVVGLSAASVVVRRLRSASLAAQTAVGAMTAGVERALSGVRTIRAAQAEDREAVVVDASSRDAFRAGLRLARLEAVLGLSRPSRRRAPSSPSWGSAERASLPTSSPSPTWWRSCCCSSCSCSRWRAASPPTAPCRRASERSRASRRSSPCPRRRRTTAACRWRSTASRSRSPSGRCSSPTRTRAVAGASDPRCCAT